MYIHLTEPIFYTYVLNGQTRLLNNDNMHLEEFSELRKTFSNA